MKLSRRQRAINFYHEVKSATLRFFIGVKWALSYRQRSQTDEDAASTIGEGRTSSLILACMATIITAFIEPRIRVVNRTPDGPKEIPGHPLTLLLRRPNPYYSGILMWTATLMDYFLTGNAYWIKVRDESGLLLELWWVPSWMITPQWPKDNPAIFLSHYEYKPNSTADPIPYDVGDIVHFRHDIDPDNPRQGISPLRALLRLVFTDEEAMRYAATILRNGGGPGVIISPAAGGKISDPEKVKTEYETRTGGDNKGRPMVMSGPVVVEKLGYSPSELELEKLQRIPEERAAAVFGTPAVIVGFGAGLQHSTYNNMSEAREHLYEGKVIPTHNFFKEELWAQLLPEFGPNDTVDVEWDYSQVRVLQEDRDKLYTRIINAFVNGLITRNQGLTELGYPTQPTGDVYAIPGKVKIVDITATAEDLAALPEPTQTTVDENGDPVDDAVADDVAKPKKPKKDYPIVETKAGDIAGYFTSVNTLHGQAIEIEMAMYLANQRSEVINRYRDGAKSFGEETKISLAKLLPFAPNASSLSGLLTKWYVRIADDVHTVTQDLLEAVYDLPESEIEDYTRQAGIFVKGITRTTRNDVAKILRASIREKWGTEKTIKAFEDATCFSHERAVLIARTELGSAANLAAIVSFENSGRVEAVSVFDGDIDPVCAAWNGRVVPMGEARGIPRLGHPQCQRSFSPIVSDSLRAVA